jgi:hypothetical protein
MENAPKSPILTLVFRNWSAVVAKFRFEQLGGVGVWLVHPSKKLVEHKTKKKGKKEKMPHSDLVTPDSTQDSDQ